MSLTADALAIMLANNVPHDVIVAVARAQEATGRTAVDTAESREEERRRKDRERKRLSRVSADAAEKTSADSPRTELLPVSPNDITLTLSSHPQSSSLRSDEAPTAPEFVEQIYDGSDVGDHHVAAFRKQANNPKLILSAVLCAETVAEVIAHRKATKCPLTAGSAKGLVKGFVKYGNPEVAAQTMMTRGWRGFDPKWMIDQPRDGPSRKTAFGHLEAIKDIRRDQSPDQLRPINEYNPSADDGERGLPGHRRDQEPDRARSQRQLFLDADRHAERQAARKAG